MSEWIGHLIIRELRIMKKKLRIQYSNRCLFRKCPAYDVYEFNDFKELN